MYYVMDMDARAQKRFIWFRQGPDDDGTQWRTGVRLVVAPDVVEMAGENPAGLPVSDFALNSFGLHVLSPRFRAMFESLGIGNIEYWPTRLQDQSSGTQRGDYCVANYLGKIACLDFKRAVVHKGRRIPIIGVDEFELLEDRIVALPGMNEAPRIFRLAEDDSRVIVHEAVRAACERGGMTGVRFTPTIECV